MAKITAWGFTIIGVLLLLSALDLFSITDKWFLWTMAIIVLVLGITKLNRNYKKR